MKKKIVNTNPPSFYPVCHSDSCPQRGSCLHAQIASEIVGELPIYVVINPAHSSYQEGANCSYYRSNTPELYAKGFTKGMNELTHQNYNYCTKYMTRYYSKSYFYRIKNGKVLLSPKGQEEVLGILRDHGYEGESPFDQFEWRYTW